MENEESSVAIRSSRRRYAVKRRADKRRSRRTHYYAVGTKVDVDVGGRGAFVELFWLT